MKAKDTLRLLKRSGFRFYRQAQGDHQIWKHTQTGNTILVALSPKRWHGWRAFKAEVKRKSMEGDRTP